MKHTETGFVLPVGDIEGMAARARLFELVGRSAVLRQQLLDLKILLGNARLKLFEHRGLERRHFGWFIGFAAGPPAAVGHLHVGHKCLYWRG